MAVEDSSRSDMELMGSLVLESTGQHVDLDRLQSGKLDLRLVFGSIHTALVAIVQATNASRLEALANRDEFAESVNAISISMDALEEETSRVAAAADFACAHQGTRFCIQYDKEAEIQNQADVLQQEAEIVNQEDDRTVELDQKRESLETLESMLPVGKEVITKEAEGDEDDEDPDDIGDLDHWEEMRSKRAETRVTRASLAPAKTRMRRGSLLRVTLPAAFQSSPQMQSSQARSHHRYLNSMSTDKNIAFHIVQEPLKPEVKSPLQQEDELDPLSPSSPGAPFHSNDEFLGDGGLAWPSSTALSPAFENRFQSIQDKIQDLELQCNIMQQKSKLQENPLKVEDVQELVSRVTNEALLEERSKTRAKIRSSLEPVMAELQEMKSDKLGAIVDYTQEHEKANVLQDANAEKISEVHALAETLRGRLDSAEEQGSLLQQELQSLRVRLNQAKEAEAAMNRTWTEGLGKLKEEMRGEIGDLALTMESTQSGGHGKWVTDKATADADELICLRSDLNEETRKRQDNQQSTSSRFEMHDLTLRSYKDALDSLWWRLSKKGVVNMQDGLDSGIKQALKEKANAMEVAKLESDAKKMGKTVKQLVEQTRMMQAQWEESPDCVVGVKCLCCSHGGDQMRTAGAMELSAAERNEALMRSTREKSWRTFSPTTEPLPPCVCEGVAYNNGIDDGKDGTAAMSKTWNSRSLPTLTSKGSSKSSKQKEAKKLRALLDAGQRGQRADVHPERHLTFD